MNVVSILKKLALVDEIWTPKIVGELNGQYVKVAKLEGEYVWHSHAEEDELFWVIDGELEIHFRDRVARLHPGEFCIVPRGVEHKPVAKTLTQIVLFEPISTRSSGAVDDPRTVDPEDLERI